MANVVGAGLHGVPPDAWLQWAGVALLVALRRPPVGPLGVRSVLPLALAMPGGFGSLLVAVIIASGGLLERSQPQRLALASGLLTLFASDRWDDHSLWLWGQAQRWLGLGQDPASTVVDIGELALRLLAWGLLGLWALRRDPPPSARSP